MLIAMTTPKDLLFIVNADTHTALYLGKAALALLFDGL